MTRIAQRGSTQALLAAAALSFLRLSISNMRMRIPYDDLPNTSRLIALCQVHV